MLTASKAYIRLFLKSEGKVMGALVPEYEVHATTIAIDPPTGNVTIGLQTDKGAIALYLGADVAFLLKDGIEKTLAEERR
jgi:hypothetical protein